MDTLTIAFEDKRMISVMKELVNSMKGVSIVSSMPEVMLKKQDSVADNAKYKISPVIKAMETGFSLPDTISDDYKKEINELRMEKYL